MYICAMHEYKWHFNKTFLCKHKSSVFDLYYICLINKRKGASVRLLQRGRHRRSEVINKTPDLSTVFAISL